MNNTNIKTIFFIVIALSIFMSLNYYMGKRMLSGFQSVYKINSKIFWILFWIVAFSYILYGALNKYFPKYLSSPLMYIGIYYMAIAAYLFITVLLIDLVTLLNSKLHFIPNSKHLPSYLTIFITLSLIILMILGSFNARNSYVKSYDIKIDKTINYSNLNIVMVSDVHLGDFIDKTRLIKMVKEINELKPDVVLIAGDLIDNSLTPFKDNNMAEELGKIESTYGTFFALGNHDIFDNKVSELSTLLEKQNITVLRDDYKLVDNSFYVVGRDDTSISRLKGERKTLKEILNGVDKSKPIIVIDHTPRDLDEPTSEKVDLQVSGHTHKGQFAPFNFVTSKIFEVDYGFKKKEDFNVVVSSGYGTWGPPIRIGSQCEIVKITLSENK